MYNEYKNHLIILARRISTITTHPSKTKNIAALIPAMNSVLTGSGLSSLVPLTNSDVVAKLLCAEIVTERYNYKKCN